MLTLPEELVLVAIDDRTGRFLLESALALDFAIAGAQLLELEAAGSVLLGDQVLAVDGSYEGDPLLDRALSVLLAESNPPALRIALYALHKNARHEYVAHLTSRGLLTADMRRQWGLISRTSYSPQREARAEIVGRLRDLLVLGHEAEARTMTLAGLVSSCSMLSNVVPHRRDLRAAKRRVGELLQNEPVRSVVRTIRQEAA